MNPRCHVMKSHLLTLLIHPTDCAENLFLQKVKNVVLVGDVVTDNLRSPTPNETTSATECSRASSQLKPGESKANMHDMPAARFFYQQCQALGVPLVIVTDSVSSTPPHHAQFAAASNCWLISHFARWRVGSGSRARFMTTWPRSLTRQLDGGCERCATSCAFVN